MKNGRRGLHLNNFILLVKRGPKELSLGNTGTQKHLELTTAYVVTHLFSNHSLNSIAEPGGHHIINL
ncbi:hypothetical protein Goarm_012154 [Gossypium armourianum]|uniref:Uncharacterized protein n=1 Tax=Gossypium armourianum TaxID=34283 RepID=A0A7J9IZ13_9ROSI|nr:hypothetical protein [Gossypium armourianum]